MKLTVTPRPQAVLDGLTRPRQAAKSPALITQGRAFLYAD
jgi:hypothetical protein